jgi:sugar-specific transcriptional regulator TrmB
VKGLWENTVEKALQDFGLTEKETQIYIYLAKHGIQKGGEIAKKTKTAKAVVYRTLKILQRKGFAESTLESPVRFKAVPFESILDANIEAKHEEARLIETAKEDLLDDWNKLSRGEIESPIEKFVVIEGTRKIYNKMYQIIKQTKYQLSIIATVPGIMRSDRYGIVNEIINHPLKDKIKFRFLTDVTNADIGAIQFLKKKLKSGADLRGRNTELGAKPFPRMIIRDQEEILFFITPSTNITSSKNEDTCLCTNCRSMIQAFSGVFEDLWFNSTDIEDRINEIESGKLTPKTYIIKAKEAYKKYYEIIRSTEEEIIMTTSAKGLVALWKSMDLVREWVERGVSVKIMAPIMSENLKAAQYLLKLCEVRHVPLGYLGTTIIDGKHLFQFENLPIEQEKLEILEYFKNVFYTNDLEYVEKTKNMLNSIWKNAYAPSAITLEAITNIDMSEVDSLSDIEMTNATKRINGLRFVKDEKPLRKLTEKILLNKFINAKRTPIKDLSKDPVIFYCSAGQAVIHPPNSFNLPHLLFHIFHLNKKSSFGAEDAIIVFSRHETSSGYSYLPAAFITDNSEALVFWKKTFAGIPFEQHVVNKNEFHVEIQHNVLFAGWTVPIPLSPQGYILPPSCILIEGYGDVKTGKYSIGNPCGDRVVNEVNYFEAFVTFMHPSSKYTGPGTDGFFFREFLSTTYPPSTT